MSRSRSRSPARGYRGGDRDYASRQGSSQYERDSRHRRYDDRERYSDEQGYRQQSRQTGRRYDHEASDSRHDRHDRPRASYRPVREEVDPPRRAPNNDGSVRVKSRPAYVEDRSPHANDKPAGTGSKGQMDDVSNDKDGKEGEDKDDDDDDAEAQMAAMMGFGGFGSTKGEKVKGNGAAGAISKPAKRVEYRQYMNRAGGFNRPLDEKSAV